MNDQIIIQAFEDNAGGLHIAVIKGDECTHWFSGFEHGGAATPSMQEEIIGAATDGVDNWDGANDDPAGCYDYFLRNQYGYRLIGEWRDAALVVHEDRMGAAGRRWARQGSARFGKARASGLV